MRKFLLVVLISTCYMVWGLIFSIQPTFYPSEAEARGAKPSEYGFVFGVIHLAGFITAPIGSHFGARIGAKRLFWIGAIMQSLAGGILFAFLDYIQNKWWFLGLSYLLRILDGLCDGFIWGAVLGILMKIFPEHVAKIMSNTELFFGLGYTIGPALGSYLYTVGGFMLPFLVVGIVAFVMGVAAIFIVPDVKQPKKQRHDNNSLLPTTSSSQNGKKKLTVREIFRQPAILIPFIDNMFGLCGFAFIESMMEPHLKDYGATQLQVGNFFLTIGAAYMVGTIMWGFICDRIKYPVVASIICNITEAVALLLIGPPAFLGISGSLALFEVAAVLIGVAGYSGIMVSTFTRSYRATQQLGFESEINTFIIVSGMWSSSFYLGNFLGASTGGFLVENLTFANATIVYFVIHVAMIAFDSVSFWLIDRKMTDNQYENL